jgi:hypothetical protein
MKHIYALLLFVFFGLFSLETNAQGNNALDFDGANDIVDCGNDTSIQIFGTKLSLEAWIYPTTWGTNVYDNNVINKEYNTSNYGFMLRVGAGGKLNFGFGNGSWHEITSSKVVLALNTWQHIAATYDGVKMRLFVNGHPTDSLAETASITNASTTNMQIGGHATYTRFFKGMIDEVRVWNIALDSAKLNLNMNREFCYRPVNLKAYYKFNQGKAAQSNTTVKKLNDYSWFKNNGTLNNFALSGTSSNWVAGKLLSKDVVNTSQTVSACVRYNSPSKKYQWTATGLYKDTLPTIVMGCDSVITVNLTIKKASSKNITVYACSSYVSPSGLYTWTQSGNYTDYLKNYVNCDSVLYIKLIVGGSRDSIYPKVCNVYTVPSKKRQFTNSGYYTDTLKNFRNCDSIVDIFLTVNKTTYSTKNVSVCNLYRSPSGKYWYTQSGTYFDTLVNAKKCDSIITTILKIKNSKSSVKVHACGQYQSPSWKYIWTNSGIYKDTILNYAFCDSVLTIDLTVHKSSTINQNAAACDRFKHPRTNKWLTQSGVYNDTIKNAFGCDSIIHSLTLTLTKIDVSVTQNQALLTANNSSGTYAWLDCGNNYQTIVGANSQQYTATKNGQYAVEITVNTCKDTSSCYTVSSLGLQSQFNQAFQLYPNPANSIIIWTSSSTVQYIKLYANSGQLILDQAVDSSAGKLDLKDLETGWYWIEMSINGNVQRQSFQIHR